MIQERTEEKKIFSPGSLELSCSKENASLMDIFLWWYSFPFGIIGHLLQCNYKIKNLIKLLKLYVNIGIFLRYVYFSHMWSINFTQFLKAFITSKEPLVQSRPACYSYIANKCLKHFHIHSHIWWFCKIYQTVQI